MLRANSKNVFRYFLNFWFFIFFFKTSASLHYTLMSPLGESILPLWIVGLLIGSAAFVQLLLDIPAGRLLDKFGYRKMIIISNLFFILSALVLLLNFNTTTYLITLFFSVLGWLFITPGINAYLLSQASKDEGGRIMSLNDIFSSLGVVVGSVLLTYTLMFQKTGMSIILTIPFLFSLLFIILSPKDKIKIHQVKHEIPSKHYYIKRNQISNLFKVIKKLNPASTMLMLLGVSSSIFYAVVWFVIPLEIAKNASNIPSFSLGVFDFAIVVFGFLLGKIADKFNKKRAVFWGLTIYSIFGLLLGFNLNLLFVIFGFLATTGEELAHLSLWSWLHTLDKDHANDGLIAGVITFAQDFGWTIGPIFAGFLYASFGARYVIVFSGMILFITWAVYEFVFNRHVSFALSSEHIPRKPHLKRYKH
jgi:MFS family permease